jgi:Cu-Zn family superoxide dismutase
VPFLVTADEHKKDAHGAEVPLPTKAVAVIRPTEVASKSNDKPIGTVTFQEKDGETLVTAEITGLTPGKHGFHIHEFGDITAPDATSAAGHFNPAEAPHGGPHEEKSHMGDLGNITADESGKAVYQETFANLPIHYILGRSVVIHAKADDLKSQPAGDAGPRVGVGVIGVAKP